jgi:uncharacterized membrane protein
MAALAAQIIFYYPELPEHMASHVDFSGKPDDWMGKTGFMALWSGMLIFMNLMVPLVNWMMKIAPRKLINVPDKEFWMGTETNRKYLAVILENMMLMMVLGIDLIFIYGMQHLYEINVHGDSDLWSWFIVVLIILITIVPVIYLFMKLRVTPEMRRRFEYDKAQNKKEQVS